MNWKSFLSQTRIVKVWLNECGYDNVVLFKIFVLILRGIDDPFIILTAASTGTPIRDAAKVNLDCCVPNEDMPIHIYETILRWVHLLPKYPEILGEIYERLALDQRTQGLYYTPPAIINFILTKTIGQYNILQNPKVKILDPSCGCGSFLLKAYDILFNQFTAVRNILQTKFPDSDWTDRGIHNHILKYNLWGSDIDHVASDIACAALLLKQPQAEQSSEPQIIVFDSLKIPDDITASPYEKTFWSQQYDFVVGNPPYLSFGLRGSKKESAQYLGYLRGTYVSAQYKLSIYALFIERGISLLKCGGKLGFIVPDSFLLGRYYSKIREYILENTHIELIAHIAIPIFKNVSTGFLTICVFAKQSKAKKDNLIDIYNIKQLSSIDNPIPSCQYAQSYFCTLPHKRFRVFFSDKAKQLIEHLDAAGLALKNFASGHTGIRALSGQNNIISVTPQSEPTWHRGLVSGGQVYQYAVQYENHWLNVDPQKLYKGGWNENVIGQRKILIRQTGYSLICAIDNDGFYHLNNIHSFVLVNKDITLDYLLLLLNSRLLAFYYHVVTLEFGRSMAQVDIETLELLPIAVDSKINWQAPDLVKIMERCTDEALTGGKHADYMKTAAFAEYLNQIVYRIYRLNDEQIKYIEEYEAKLAVSLKNNRRKH